MSDEEAYDVGIRKLGLSRPMHGDDLWPPIIPDLRKDRAFAWRVLVEMARHRELNTLIWHSIKESPNPADALYAAVCALGRSDDANT